MAVDPDKPFNREEMYLAKAAGEGTTVPDEPWSRKEAYLEKISGRIDEAEEDISELDEKVAALATDISLKGSVADYAHLPTDAAIGDAYITEDTGILYVWVGDEWTPLNMQGGASDIFFIQRQTTGQHLVTSSFDDIKEAFNSGKLLVIDGYISNEFNSTIHALGFCWKNTNPGGTGDIGDSGSYYLDFWCRGAGATTGAYCDGRCTLTLNATNKTITCGTGNSLTTVIYSRNNLNTLVPSAGAVVGITGFASNLTTSSKTNLVSAINELVTNMGGAKIVVLTQDQYDVLATKDPNTLYIIKAA